MKKFIITKQNSSQRLDKFLTKNWPEYSRAYLKSQIKFGKVLVNKQIKKPSYILKENDKIEAEILPPLSISLEPDATIKFTIIHEDSNVIVVDKPAGLTVHPSETQKNGTLINALLAHYPPLRQVGDDPLRPGLVHRLDKDTSGLMIIAKNNQAFEFLKNQFKNKRVEKKYLALVVGAPKEQSGTIKTYLTRSKSDPTKQKVSGTLNAKVPDTFLSTLNAKVPDTFALGREAITTYKTLREFKHFTLIEAQPKTGRMHQIRVHLAWLGCPVAGDQKYGQKSLPTPKGLKRQFLHATELTIALPNGQKQTFTSPLPGDLLQILIGIEKNMIK